MNATQASMAPTATNARTVGTAAATTGPAGMAPALATAVCGAATVGISAPEAKPTPATATAPAVKVLPEPGRARAPRRILVQIAQGNAYHQRRILATATVNATMLMACAPAIPVIFELPVETRALELPAPAHALGMAHARTERGDPVHAAVTTAGTAHRAAMSVLEAHPIRAPDTALVAMRRVPVHAYPPARHVGLRQRAMNATQASTAIAAPNAPTVGTAVATTGPAGMAPALATTVCGAATVGISALEVKPTPATATAPAVKALPEPGRARAPRRISVQIA